MPALESQKALLIDIGRLTSLPQFIGKIAKPLRIFSDAWLTKAQTRVVWDLRNIDAGSIDTTALASFCAAATRLRKYTWSRPLAYPPPRRAQQFLYGIGFFKIVRDNDLFEFPEGSIGGFAIPNYHPATQIFSIRRVPETIPSGKSPRIGDWKDDCREEFRMQMLYRHNCYRLFVPGGTPHTLDGEAVNSILNSCAEFATNAVLWGKSDAFVAIQVGRTSFSASVCDAGEGLRSSLLAKCSESAPKKPKDDHEATFFASIFNRHAMGLFHTITAVLKRGGNVSISSGEAELHWRPALWRRVCAHLEMDRSIVFQPGSTHRLLGEILRGHAPSDIYFDGIRREWKPGLRGTRVVFQLPYTR